MDVFGSGMVGGTHLSMGEVTASKSSALSARYRRFRPPGSASCSHARDPSAETTRIAVSTRQAGRARLPARGAAKEKIPWCELKTGSRQGRCGARPSFGRAVAAHPRLAPVDSSSTPYGRAVGLPCARRTEMCATVRAKPARKHKADVRDLASALSLHARARGSGHRASAPGTLWASAEVAQESSRPLGRSTE